MKDLLSYSKRTWAVTGWDRKSPDKMLIGCGCMGWRVTRGKSCFLENCVSTDDWQCRYIRGRFCTYVVLNEVEKHVPYGELVGIRECLTLYPRCRTNRGRYNRAQLYMHNVKCL
jgi:hypothetical protein